MNTGRKLNRRARINPPRPAVYSGVEACDDSAMRRVMDKDVTDRAPRIVPEKRYNGFTLRELRTAIDKAPRDSDPIEVVAKLLTENVAAHKFGQMIKLERCKEEPLVKQMVDCRAVLIWSTEHKARWRPGGSGYTVDAQEAWGLKGADAFRLTSHCGPEKGIVFELL